MIVVGCNPVGKKRYKNKTLDVHQHIVVATIKGSGISEDARALATFTCDRQYCLDVTRSVSACHRAII